MYLRAAHAEPDIPVLQQFIQSNPLGILITALPASPKFPTLQCTHIPWILDLPNYQSSTGSSHENTDLGTLRGHIAKANPHSKALVEAAQVSSEASSLPATSHVLEQEVTVLFNGPVESYVTPHFYTHTKPHTGKVVPTWNYSAVQVYGTLTLYYVTSDSQTGAFLQRQIRDLTKFAERDVMQHTGSEYSRPEAWEVDDAPASYVDALRKSINGLEIKITRLEGKFKMSQEMGVEDREGVEQGFKGMETDKGRDMAETVHERGKLKDAKAA